MFNTGSNIGFTVHVCLLTWCYGGRKHVLLTQTVFSDYMESCHLSCNPLFNNDVLCMPLLVTYHMPWQAKTGEETGSWLCFLSIRCKRILMFLYNYVFLTKLLTQKMIHTIIGELPFSALQHDQAWTWIQVNIKLKGDSKCQRFRSPAIFW